jgi:hypothetical protein
MFNDFACEIMFDFNFNTSRNQAQKKSESLLVIVSGGRRSVSVVVRSELGFSKLVK